MEEETNIPMKKITIEKDNNDKGLTFEFTFGKILAIHGVSMGVTLGYFIVMGFLLITSETIPHPIVTTSIVLIGLITYIYTWFKFKKYFSTL